jgi:hypothetical protein
MESSAQTFRFAIQLAVACIMATSVLGSLITAVLLMRTDRRQQQRSQPID